MSDKNIAVPKMIHLRREVKKAVDPLEMALRTIAELRKKEFLEIHCKFYGKSEVRKAITCEEVGSQPVTTLLNPDYFEKNEEPKYEYEPLLQLDEGDDWYYSGSTDFTDEYRYSWSTGGTQEEADELEGGIIKVDLHYDEISGKGFYLMSAKGLKMLKEDDPQLYKAMTCLKDGRIDEDFEIVERIERYASGEEEGSNLLVDNFYGWRYSVHEGAYFDTYRHEKEWKGEKRVFSRERAGGDLEGELRDLIEIAMLNQVYANHIL